MYIVKGFFIIFILLFCAVQVGKLWNREGTYIEALALGFATMLAIFNLFCIPMHILQVRFSVLCIIYTVFLVGVVFLSLILSFVKKRRYRLIWDRAPLNLFFLAAVILIIIQIYRLLVYEPANYGDDKLYIAMVNDIWHSDTIHGYLPFTGEETTPYSLKYMATSWYPFLAYWCKLFDFHPLLLMKTFLPVLTTILAYGVFWMLGAFFMKDDMRRRSIYFLFIVLFVEFENISYHFISRKFLQWPWQSKSVLYTILMPLLFYYAVRYTMDKLGKKEIAVLAVVLFANGAASLMGVGFSTIMLFLIGIVMMIQKRSPAVMGKVSVSCIPTALILAISVLTA